MEQLAREAAGARSRGQGSPISTRRSSSNSVSQQRKSEQAEKDAIDESNPKVKAILDACRWRNIDELKILAVSKGGFLLDRLRQQAWPVLLGLTAENVGQVDASGDDGPGSSSTSWKELPPHRDEDQVQLDVNRAFTYYPTHDTPAELDQQKADLSNLIVEVLRRHPYLCYFQGYHDICQVFLLVLTAPQRAPAMARLSTLRIRDFMLPNLNPAIAQLRLLPDILRASDPSLWRHLSHTEPFFALSGTLTMYAHDVQTLGEIARLFDALLAREPVFSIYVFAAIVRSRRDELFDTPDSEPEMLHSILSKLPASLDIDALLAEADALGRTHPPETLPAWGAISRASVLKTARDSAACAGQSVADGKACFDRHVAELRREEARKRALVVLYAYRRHIGVVGAALSLVLAFWLVRKSPGPLASLASWVSRWTGFDLRGLRVGL